MPKMDFQMAGFLFAFFGGLFLFLFAVWLTGKRDRIPAYKKRLPKVTYGDEVRELLMVGYAMVKDLEGMLLFTIKHCPDKKARVHFKAALSYLHQSRYRDYETALYFYAADGSREQKIFFEKIIRAEAEKNRRLPQKEEQME